MKAKHKRLQLILIAIICAGFGLWLILKNFNENIVFFYSPTELKVKSVNNQLIRVGGLVSVNSIIKIEDGLTTQFIITDNKNNLVIRFKGVLPNLFRENQGIVAKGKLVDDIFIANELLAKHDENYMPKEVTKALEKGQCPTCK